MLYNLVMNEYLTLAEASELIGKSKETLRRWDKEGKLSAVREPISNYRLYKKDEVQSLFSDFSHKKLKKRFQIMLSLKMNIAF